MKKILFLLLVLGSYTSIQAQSKINDADNNTTVETERFANEDLIRFKIGGLDAFRMKNRTLEVFNSGNSVYFGQDAGINDDLANRRNVGLGRGTLQLNTSGRLNMAVGYFALSKNVTGNGNSAIGSLALLNTTSGINNTAIGSNAGVKNTIGNANTYIGVQSGLENVDGNRNTLIGFQAGKGSVGVSKSDNVFIGYQAGFSDDSSNKLYIENSNDVTTPLIYGDFANNQLSIGTSTPATGYALSVNGKGIFTEVRVLEFDNGGGPGSGWPDYVFKSDYDLKTIEEVEGFINENGHLPNIPSAKTVEKEGIALGDMNKNLLEKIEELTLYMIDMNKDVKQLKAENEALKNEVAKLKK